MSSIKKILSYGALRKENRSLEIKVKKLEGICELLREEVCVQKNVIAQLNHLYKSYSSLLNKSRTLREACCDGGHFGCRILHARFNLTSLRN